MIPKKYKSYRLKLKDNFFEKEYSMPTLLYWEIDDRISSVFASILDVKSEIHSRTRNIVYDTSEI